MWALYKRIVRFFLFFSWVYCYLHLLLATGLVLWLFPNEFSITLGGYAVLDGLLYWHFCFISFTSYYYENVCRGI